MGIVQAYLWECNCDKCGKTLTATLYRSPYDVRCHAIARGWVCRGKVTLCPECGKEILEKEALEDHDR